LFIDCLELRENCTHSNNFWIFASVKTDMVMRFAASDATYILGVVLVLAGTGFVSWVEADSTSFGLLHEGNFLRY
jgi:hypothetical protein